MKAWITTIGLMALLLAGTNSCLGRAKEAPQRTESPGSDGSGAESNPEDLSYSPTAWPDAPDTSVMLRRLVLGTVTVLGLCVCTMWGGRRWLRGAPARTSTGATLRHLETVSLGNRCAVHLVQAGSHQILVGVDGGGIKSLVPLPQSFESAIAEAGAPAFETAETFEGRDLRIS
jgi:flagellar biogenesis protein FliO